MTSQRVPFGDILLMLLERFRKNVPPCPVSDKIDRFGRSGVQHSRNAFPAGIGDRSIRQARPPVGVIAVVVHELGTANSSARIGVVSVNGGATTWMKIPGDPRNNYLARMDWAANSTELTIQQLNRRQNQNTMWVAESRTGTARTLFVVRDN